MLKQSDFLNLKESTWCAGCTNFALHRALVQALIELNIKPHNTAITFDIGCAGNACNIYKTYGFHLLHGRIIPVAMGAKTANDKLTVIAIGGDGGVYGEGVGHLIEACRANPDITTIVSNNKLYSLTKGQASPTSKKGVKTKSTPYGLDKPALNPLTRALSSEAKFIARGYTGEVKHLTEIFKKAISYKGFSLVDVLQPCITLDKINTREYYKERVYRLGKNWPTKNKDKAFKKLQEDKKIPLGIFYKK